MLDLLRIAAFILIIAGSCGWLLWQYWTRAFEVDDLDALPDEWMPGRVVEKR